MLYDRLSREIFKQIQKSNQLLTGHENLEIYAGLQKMTSAFSSSQDHQDKIQLRNQKITNPYLLESEACQKCFSQRSLPFTQYRLQDLKAEAKFTESNIIYKMTSTYQIKQITLTQDNFKGSQVIKEIVVYINNKQGVDLADMKNNLALWQKVKNQEVQPGQRQVVIDFILPVNASNILIQFVTCISSKPLLKDGRNRPEKAGKSNKKDNQKFEKVESVHQVLGIDTVLTTLPIAIAANLGIIQGTQEQSRDENGAVIDNEVIICPRCAKAVQGKHGICNSCGENAMQCTYCRNINYEKPDGFLCNECGNSRFAKFEIGITVKQGFAQEKIETEEAKTQAMNQIESNLQSAQTNYSLLMKKRQIISALMKKVNEGGSECSKMVSDMYTEECSELYQKMMKSLNQIKILKQELDAYTQIGQQGVEVQLEKASSSVLTRQVSAISSIEEEQVNESCFSCIQEYLKGLLTFIHNTSDNLSTLFLEKGFIELLYKENLKMYTSSLQDPARKAISSILKKEKERGLTLLQSIYDDLFAKQGVIPAHLLSSNINQETYLVLELLRQQQALKTQDGNYYHLCLKFMWKILLKSLKEGQSNSAIGDQVAGTFFGFIRDQIKDQSENSSKEIKDINNQLFDSKSVITNDLSQSQQEYIGGQNYLMFALTLQSSQRVRSEAKDIIQIILQGNQSAQVGILRQLISIIEKVLTLESSAGDQYFDLLSLVLSGATIKEKVTEQSLRKESETHIYVEAFDLLFKQIDKELIKLLQQEKQRQALGQDGFMPQISTGQIFSRVVSLVSSMIKESVHLKGIIQNNVNIVIKSFLKIRKLNLTKNKVIQQSEVEIEKMFKELHSQKEDEKGNFILECIKLIESGECDNQEMRFLFEEMCKVIDPIKPEPEYQLQLTRAHSQEFYFRGKMSKNPYLSSQLGKTMADVRLKICKEMELAEPELLELLVQGKIVGMDLTIRQVYEQVNWPAVCRQRNPDQYDIPSIEEAPKGSLQPMQVIYRLMGIDGEAQEDRVENLQDSSEADNDPAIVQKKYGMTSVLCQEFQSRKNPGLNTNGVKVLIEVLENFGSLAQQRYFSEWLFKLIGLALKIKSNRQEFMKHKQTVDHFAKRLFESVGVQSQIEGQKGVTLFDVILVILDQVIAEVNSVSIVDEGQSDQYMDIDEVENIESATHIQLFIKIMSDACNEMVEAHQNLDKTSKKIRAVSKILPFLINKLDIQAQKIIVTFIEEALYKIPLLDNLAELTAKEKFSAQFNLERLIEILDTIPVNKVFLKDVILDACSPLFESMWKYFLNTTMIDISQENLVFKHKLANSYTLRLMTSLFRNHPRSQAVMIQSYKNILDKIYELTQAKHKDKCLTILANDLVETLTNKNNQNEAEVKDYLQGLINKQNDEKKRLAAKKREEIMKAMEAKKSANKFMKQLGNPTLQEETGPKCIVCQEGYTKKPSEVLGMYVFSKKLKLNEISSNGTGFTTTQGYTTVTHSNFIHITCHSNAYRADSQLRQPKKEWEGAAIRNDHTKCNNLFPLRGGNLSVDSYGSTVEQYFHSISKSVGNCDNDRVKVLQHDFKMLIKRLAFEDSFSRDSQGGGPEHNMHLIPFFIQMIQYLLTSQQGSRQYALNKNSGVESSFSFIQEQKLAEFLEQGMNKKKDFLQRLEEEKRVEELEEDEKNSDDEMPEDGKKKAGDDGENSKMNDLSLDQIALMLTKCIIYCQLTQWEKDYKHKFFSIILCTVANMKDDKSLDDLPKAVGVQSDFATGKRVLTITKQSQSSDVPMINTEEIAQIGALNGGASSESKRRRLSSDIKSTDVIQKALIRLRPLLVMMRLVDNIKQRWDRAKLGLDQKAEQSTDKYVNRLVEELLCKGNLQEVISECDELFKEYKDRTLKISSVEEFLSDLGMIEQVVQASGLPSGSTTSQAVEQYIISHFQA